MTATTTMTKRKAIVVGPAADVAGDDDGHSRAVCSPHYRHHHVPVI